MSPRKRAPLPVRVLLAAGAVGLSGCFSYVAVPMESAAVGSEYRVVLTRARMEQLRDLDPSGLPEIGAPQLRGTLVERSGGELALRIPVATRQVGIHQTDIERQIRIPVGDVVEVERRRLDRARTGLAVGGLLALTGFVIFTTLEGARFWDQNPDGPPPDALRPFPALLPGR